MTVTLIRLTLTAFLLPGLTACLGALSSPTPPEYFQVDYAHEPTECSVMADREVRIWPFSASSPYDREQMIVLGGSRKVRFSSQYRWVSLPGDMIADKLLRDLTYSGLFARVVSSVDPFKASSEMSGHVFRFALEEDESRVRAVLDVEIRLWDEEPKRAVRFKKHYRLESDPISKGSPEGFADAMSGLVQRLSRELRQDLCATRSGSSSPGGG